MVTQVDREHILAEIHRTANENGGRPLGRARFATETGIMEKDWSGRYWARWGDALAEAGFEPNQLRAKFDDDEVLTKLLKEIRRLGRMPTGPELRLRRRQDPDFPASGVFERLGKKAALMGRAAQFCEAHPEYVDVLGILVPLLVPDEAEESEPDDNGPTDSGFVYLLRSGRYFKIGRTNSFGRRERELAIQLPQPATRVHVIQTDDPAGIERYWHARFAERRRNGEWFELTPADVKAFKTRKTM